MLAFIYIFIKELKRNKKDKQNEKTKTIISQINFLKVADFSGKMMLQRTIALVARPGGNVLKYFAYFEPISLVILFI